MDEEKLRLLKADFKLATTQPNRIKALAAVFDKHRDFISSLTVDESLIVENDLRFWQATEQK